MAMGGDARLTTTQVARRLGVEPEDVYRLIFGGELDGSPDDDGVVRLDERVVAGYLEGQTRV